MIEGKELSKRDIAHRAYKLYVQRGCEPGRDIEDWVRAEKEMSSEIVIRPQQERWVYNADRNSSN